MRLELKNALTWSPVLWLMYRLIRAYLWTLRLTVENERTWMEHLENGGRVLLCTWHQQFFAAIRHFRNYSAYKPALMISRSRDGEMIAGVASRTGWDPVRGSSSRGGKEALGEMVEKLRQRGLAAHIADGPRGPAGELKAGAIRLAREGDAVIVPFHIFPEKAWYFNSWDHFMLPKPFSRVTLRFGDPISLPDIESPQAFEEQRRFVQNTMLPYLVRPGASR